MLTAENGVFFSEDSACFALHASAAFIARINELLVHDACGFHELLAIARSGGLLELVALGDLGQPFFIVIGHIIAAFFIDFEKAVKEDNLTCGAQGDLFICRGNIDSCPLHPRTFHLAGQRAFPDQIIKLALVAIHELERICVL